MTRAWPRGVVAALTLTWTAMGVITVTQSEEQENELDRA